MSERWNKDIKVIDPHELLDEKSREAVRQREMATFQFKELEKTNKELIGIDNLNESIARVFEAFGLEPVAVESKKIHVLSAEEFDSMKKRGFVSDTVIAFFSAGHIFVERLDDEKKWLRDLSHEMAHAVSFQSIRRFVTGEDKKNITVKSRSKRTGYGFWKPEGLGLRGLNEGVTEFISQGVRHEYADQFMKEADDEEKKKFAASFTYVSQLMLLDEIFKIVGGGNEEAGLRECIRSFINGDLSFFKKIEKFKKGSVKILTEMGSKPGDALEAAEKLGFSGLAQEIKEFIERNKKEK